MYFIIKTQKVRIFCVFILIYKQKIKLKNKQKFKNVNIVKQKILL